MSKNPYFGVCIYVTYIIYAKRCSGTRMHVHSDFCIRPAEVVATANTQVHRKRGLVITDIFILWMVLGQTELLHVQYLDFPFELFRILDTHITREQKMYNFFSFPLFHLLVLFLIFHIFYFIFARLVRNKCKSVGKCVCVL